HRALEVDLATAALECELGRQSLVALLAYAEIDLQRSTVHHGIASERIRTVDRADGGGEVRLLGHDPDTGPRIAKGDGPFLDDEPAERQGLGRAGLRCSGLGIGARWCEF